LNLSNPSEGWLKKASLPLIAVNRKKKVKEGGCIEYYRRMFYAVKGGKTREFWSYDPGRDAWSYLCEIGDGAPVPPAKGVACGRSLTAAEYGIYILFGNNTDDFYFFTPALDTAPAAPNSQAANHPSPAKLCLQVFPNPCRNVTTIRYTLPEPGLCRLSLYDVTGRLATTLASGYQNAGTSSFAIHRSSLSAGIYLLKLETRSSGHETQVTTSKLIIE